VVDTTDSVGLRGRSGIGEGSARAAREELEVPRPEAELRCSLDVLAKLREEDEALMVCSLRRRSSNGAPVLLRSMLDPRSRRGLRTGVREEELYVDLLNHGTREERAVMSLFLDLRKTVCGTTPSF
jgi:hypothetical protein